MPRAPELGDQCRPGGTCPECNAKPIYCPRCGDIEVKHEDDLCEDCEIDRAVEDKDED